MRVFRTRELVVVCVRRLTGMAEVNERRLGSSHQRLQGRSEQAVRARQDHARN
jgi:hypothetical protein